MNNERVIVFESADDKEELFNEFDPVNTFVLGRLKMGVGTATVGAVVDVNGLFVGDLVLGLKEGEEVLPVGDCVGGPSVIANVIAYGGLTLSTKS